MAPVPPKTPHPNSNERMIPFPPKTPCQTSSDTAYTDAIEEILSMPMDEDWKTPVPPAKPCPRIPEQLVPAPPTAPCPGNKRHKWQPNKVGKEVIFTRANSYNRRCRMRLPSVSVSVSKEDLTFDDLIADMTQP
jgi:hypothetical protein